MIVYSRSITPRLQYITDFIGKELTGTPFELTDKKELFQNYPGPRINYSLEKITTDEFWIQPHPLLFDTGTRQQVIECFELNGQKGFFKTGGDLPFDIFAASFYLLTRYEEYLPHQKDMYGRYAHENSLAFKERFLNIPLVNTWLDNFKKYLQQKFTNFKPQTSKFKLIPTYDIDEAYSFKNKQWWRTSGATIKDLLKGDLKKIALRRQVLSNKIKDPFDSYDWLDKLHKKYKLEPRYFFLVAKRTGKYDKNILPGKIALQEIIKQHADKYKVGIHPSWQSGDDPVLLHKEISTLSTITGKKIDSSRQHFIRFTLPETFSHLIEAGIREDYSMGYGSINGFRASIASSFYWYDLEKDKQTELLLHPFCYMEANSFFEQKFSPLQALEEMRYYHATIKAVNGTFISIWHNTFLGTAKLFEGWREVYMQFIDEAVWVSPAI